MPNHIERIQRFEQILEGTRIGTWEWNVQTGETRLNKRWGEMIGYKLEDLEPTSHDTWLNLVHPEDRIMSDAALLRHMNGEVDYYQCEVRMKHRDGHWVWVLDTGKIASRTSDGKPEWVAGSHIDITDRRQREELLIHYTDLLDKSNEVARIGTWEIDLATLYGILSRITREILEIGETDRLTIQQGVDFFKAGPNREIVARRLNEAIEKGQEFDLDAQIITTSGKEKWVRLVGIPEVEKGVCKRVYGLVQDIDEKNSLYQNLVLQERQFRHTFENAPNGMALINEAGGWINVNASFCAMLGYTAQELMQFQFFEITHPDDVERDLKYGKDLLEGRCESYQLEKRFIHKNGSIVWATKSVSIVRNNEGLPNHFIAQVNDITEVKQAQLEIQNLLDVTREQNNRLLNFAHIVSHNLRSHVGNFSMLLDLIRMEVPESTENEFFPLLQQSTDGLQNTITHLNEVVTFNPRLVEELDSLNLSKFVSNALIGVNAQIIESKIEVVNKVDAGFMVKALPAYLDSILINFLTNAIKYRSKSKKPFIHLSAEKSDAYIALSIEDNGMGIDLNLHGKKLFGMYKTFHGNDDARGVGLFLTKNQIEAIKGKIEVSSQVNHGTIFKVYFLDAGDQ